MLGYAVRVPRSTKVRVARVLLAKMADCALRLYQSARHHESKLGYVRTGGTAPKKVRLFYTGALHHES